MPKTLLAALVGAALASPALAQVLPSGPQLRAGSASVSTSGSAMTIDQATSRAILDWQSFSIGADASVHFHQPGASSVALNRVVGANPSEIFGRLTANGQVFLTNPTGVLFAPGASVEVGSLLATTLSISDADFMNGRYVFSGGSTASVVNRGSISTPDGYAALAGHRVRNEGLIVAQLGSVALAAGQRVSLDMVGDGLINVSVDLPALNASAVNTGTLEANGGRVLMTAHSASLLLDTVINSSGTIRANRLAEHDGHIVLDAGARGNVEVSGTLEALGGDSSVTITGGGGLPGPAIPVSGPGTISIAPQIPLSEQAAITWQTFSIGASESIQFAQPTGSLSLTSTGTAGNLQIYGSVMPNTGTIGLLGPMQHSIVGTGVTVPNTGFITLQ
jgi:filamentous hemagglutinin family protein